MKTNIAQVKYPETFAEKIRKMFNNDSTLYAKALEQVRFIYQLFKKKQTWCFFSLVLRNFILF